MSLNESDIYPFSVTDLSSKDALVIAPHPDDETLGCGGSIIKHVQAGSRVKVIFLTNGDKGDFKGKFGKDYINIRKKSASKAMEILGVNDFEFWEFGDREINASLDKISEKIKNSMETFNPSVIYATSPLEAHPDHKSAFNLVWQFREIFKGCFAFYEVLMALYPNILVDITSQFQKKQKAIKQYKTENYYNDYLEKISGLNRFRTATLPNSIKYAEAFLLINTPLSASYLNSNFIFNSQFHFINNV
ncbi:MAG: PIG-L family deacetylase [Nitrospirae bacterium]|nr:PIG-L family deacetylase [Nitrospirota bacterium]